MGIGYKLFYRKPKKWLWNAYINKLIPARVDYYIHNLPDLQISGWGLDIGCGKGLITSRIADKYGIKMVGVDMINRREDEGAFLLADGIRLPFKDGLFSLVTCFSLIEHVLVEQRAKLYGEVYRVLCQGGHLVIQHPNRYFFIEQHSYLPFIGYLPSQLHGVFYQDYCRIPSKNKLLADLVSAGFRLESLDILEAPYLPPSKLLSKMKIFRLFPFGYLITLRKPLTSKAAN